MLVYTMVYAVLWIKPIIVCDSSHSLYKLIVTFSILQFGFRFCSLTKIVLLKQWPQSSLGDFILFLFKHCKYKLLHSRYTPGKFQTIWMLFAFPFNIALHNAYIYVYTMRSEFYTILARAGHNLNKTSFTLHNSRATIHSIPYTRMTREHNIWNQIW